MHPFQKVNERFAANEDYRRIGAVVFGAAQAYTGWQKGRSFQEYWDAYHKVPYACEIIEILNQPDITVDEMWVNYDKRTGPKGLDPYKLTEEVYKSEPEFWQVLITLVNALRHTVKPANCSY